MTRFRTFLLAGTACLACLGGLSAQAQTATSTPSGDAVETVIVTGSRIARANLDQPVPVSVISNVQIENAGTTDLGDILALNPALGFKGTTRGTDGTGSTGLSTAGISNIDLRNLGTNRTLVLVDGVRHVGATAGTTAVDINAIPAATVDHVEVLTGGASAIYGSDAVSGVVNIITKKSFTGLEANAQGGGATDGSYGRTWSVSLTGGTNFDGDRGNVMVTGIYDHTDVLMAKQIPSIGNYGSVVNPADCAAGATVNGLCTAPILHDGIPDNLTVSNYYGVNLGPNTTLQDRRYTDGRALTSFTAAGVPTPAPTEIAYSSLYFGQVTAPCNGNCYDITKYEAISPELEHKGVDAAVSYNLPWDITARLEAKYIQTNVGDPNYPIFTVSSFILKPDNAFITPAISQALAGIPTAQYPYINREFADIGPRGGNASHETFRIVDTFEGHIDTSLADVKWNTALNYGQTRDSVNYQGLYLTGNMAAAMDSVINPATGQAACRINVPAAQPVGYAAPGSLLGAASACVPYNPFGQQNSAAAINYVKYNTGVQSSTLTQSTAEANIVFDTSRFLTLPGGAISFAAGYQYRREASSFTNDAIILSGITNLAATPNSTARYSVNEEYVEATIPVLKDIPLVKEFTLDAAARFAEYSTVGQANAYHVGAIYAPIDGLKFRGTYATAVRAPNIIEAFSPATPSLKGVSDPCDKANIGLGPYRTANCSAAGVPTNFTSNTAVSIPIITSGNAALTPEKSTSYTFGAIVEPADGLAITVDYYDIKINDAISLVATQTIINNCFDSPTGINNPSCGLLTRDATTHNINSARTTYVNSSRLQTQGVDASVSYVTDVGSFTQDWGFLSALNGQLRVSGTASYLEQLAQAPFQTSPTVYTQMAGSLDIPRWKALLNANYRQGEWDFGVQARYLGAVRLYSSTSNIADYPETNNFARISDKVYFNGTVAYSPAYLEGTRFMLGVNNIFDLKYPVGLADANTQTISSPSYDVLGRYLFAGVNYRL